MTTTRVRPPRVMSQRHLARARWRNMIARCTNPKSTAWKWYGARGITVDPRWMDFETYYQHTGDRPEGMSLDRINNDGPYSPENVRWATPSEQRVNSRPSVSMPVTAFLNSQKTHCPKGHPYDEANTKWGERGRSCRACAAESSRLRWARERTAFDPAVINSLATVGAAPP